MVIRLVSVPDELELPEFHKIFCRILGWSSDLGYILRLHGQEFNSFRRKTRSKALHEFRLHRQEKFLCICNTLDLWEWDIRVLDIQNGVEDADAPVCLGGRGATPPEFCGGPTGYRLMLKRQREGASMSDPVLMEAGIQMFAEACPDQPGQTWELLRSTLKEGLQSIDRRLKESGPLGPNRFSVEEANERLAGLTPCPEDLAMETLGINLTESKTLLQGLQNLVVSHQVSENLARRRLCSQCGQPHSPKSFGQTKVKTVFGSVAVPNPQWKQCPCQVEGPKTFRPVTAWLTGVPVPRCCIWRRSGPR